MPYQAAKATQGTGSITLDPEDEADHPKTGADLLLSLTKGIRRSTTEPIVSPGMESSGPSAKSPILYHSPIKVKTLSDSKQLVDRSTGHSATQTGQAPAWSPTSLNGRLPVFHASFGVSPEDAKRQVSSDSVEGNAESKKRIRQDEEKKDAEEDELKQPGKQRLISPSSSNEKYDDDVDSSAPQKSQKSWASYPPWHQVAPGYNAQPLPSHAVPLAPSYRHPPPPHYAHYPHYPPHWTLYGGPPPPHLHGMYAALPSQQPFSSQQQLHHQTNQKNQIQNQKQQTQQPPASSVAAVSKSIESEKNADWQSSAATIAASANRCVSLKHPIPTRYWGNTVQDRKLPDFSRLVNFPDYLARGRNSNSSTNTSVDGKKNCVMCGKLRICSATSSSAAISSRRGCEETVHIIPRQNKGVCTVCDVSVWVVLEQEGLEIKWCKGCKNFRPWEAFGEKGNATKCTKCRKRQKEKYATQKNRSEDNDAAKGLQSLMNS